MSQYKKGIAIAGNMLCDVVKSIECYPEIGMLADIKSVSMAVGGCVPNTAINLSKIENRIPLYAIGIVGQDDYGSYVKSKLEENNIDISRVITTDCSPTSFSDVMSLPSGERTFFHHRGANAYFAPKHIDIASLECDILHIGYALLLDKFDENDAEFGTVMARFLCSVQKAGIKTSLDAVSSSTLSFSQIIKPSLKYCDYIIFNEVECCGIWGISAYKDNALDIDAIKKAMELTLAEGVREKVIVHCKQAGFCLDKSGEFTVVPSLEIPSEQIKGSVGAGDAFCAGSLYCLYNGFDDKKLLEFASAAAACNLFSENSVDGMLDKNGVEAVSKKYKRKEL